MKFLSAILLILVFMTNAYSQEPNNEQIPYYQIPDIPESYTAGAVAARMVDGLGFRYYWATEGLRAQDLAYKPSEEARTSEETIDHLYGLSKVIVHATTQTVNDRTLPKEAALNFKEKRLKTLLNFKKASDILRESNDLSSFTIVFKNEKGSSEFPFWNNINGPIADAIWHCGQVVLLRRASGNPFNSKASVFTGKVRE